MTSGPAGGHRQGATACRRGGVPPAAGKFGAPVEEGGPRYGKEIAQAAPTPGSQRDVENSPPAPTVLERTRIGPKGASYEVHRACLQQPRRVRGSVANRARRADDQGRRVPQGVQRLRGAPQRGR